MGESKKTKDRKTPALGSKPQKKTYERDDLSAGDASPRAVMSRLVREFIAPHWRVLAVGLSAMVFVAATTGALPYLMKLVADEILEGKNEALLFTLPLVILVVMTSRALADWVSRVADAWLGGRVIADLRIRMFDVLAYADLSWIQDTHSGRFVSAFVNDVPVVDRAGAKPLTSMVKNGLSTIFLVGMMFYMDWKLSVLTIIGMPIALIFLRRQKKRIKNASQKSLREAGDFGSLLTQTIQGIRVVKAYGQEDAEAARVRSVVNNIMYYLVKTAKARAAVAPITEFVAGLGFAAAVFYAGWQSIYANVTLGDFMGFITAAMLMYQPLRSLFNLQAQMTEGVTAANRIFAIIDHDRKVTEPKNAPALKVPEGRITFTDVEFAYEEDLPILSGFELDIEPGEKIALVGPSGSGKSTVLNLVLRFFDPQTGTVQIDGQDISQVSLSSLRSQIALLTQDPVLFDENLTDIYAARMVATEDVSADDGKPQARDGERLQTHIPAVACTTDDCISVCKIRDFSTGGAMLEWIDGTPADFEFILNVPKYGIAIRCRPIWRRGRKVGVSFLPGRPDSRNVAERASGNKSEETASELVQAAKAAARTWPDGWARTTIYHEKAA